MNVAPNDSSFWYVGLGMVVMANGYMLFDMIANASQNVPQLAVLAAAPVVYLALQNQMFKIHQ